MVIQIFSLAILVSLISSEPIIYIAEAKDIILLEKAVSPEEVVVTRDCSCIKGARDYGVDIPYNTDAKDLKTNTMPVVGALILLTYPNSEHVGVTIEFDGVGVLFYEENFDNPPNGCRQGFRFVKWGSKEIKGFWINK